MQKISNTTFILSIALFLGLFVSKQSFALGKVGHKVVCKIAYDNISPALQTKVDNLVNHLPKKHKKLINKYHHQKTNADISYIDTCSWADAIKRDKSYNKFKPWHYISVPRNTLKITDKSCKKHCITTAITFHTNALINEESPWKKLQALMFLSHWVGDIHQPMHVGYASDRGGNKIKVKYKESKCKNMHWLWDECLLYPVAKVRNQEVFFQQSYKNALSYSTPALTKKWQQSTLYDWATESLAIARTPSVSYCSLQKNNVCAPIAKKMQKLPASYQKDHQPILERRILQAGLRLAQTLEKALE